MADINTDTSDDTNIVTRLYNPDGLYMSLGVDELCELGQALGISLGQDIEGASLLDAYDRACVDKGDALLAEFAEIARGALVRAITEGRIAILYWQ